jgi:subtilisin family serine protease
MRAVRLTLAGLVAALGLASPAAAATPGAPYAPQYYLDQWHAARLWASGVTGHGITIAEIDTGVDASNGVFAGRLVGGTDFGRLGGDGRTDRDKSPYGHGTSMASIMVGRPGRFGIRGLAPGARVTPVAIPIDGTTDVAANDHLAEAIRWAADHGARIISLSLSGVQHRAAACPADEQRAIFHALRTGALVLAASGNSGPRLGAPEDPGVCLGVASVGAVNRRGVVARFSSRHRYLALTAPGVDIASIGPGGAPFAGNGTSQATALVSAVAALVWSAHPALTAPRVLARIIATTDRHSATPDPAYGYGTVNAYRAVTARVPRNAPDPVFALAQRFLPGPAARAAAAPPAVATSAAPPGRYAVRPPAQPSHAAAIGWAVLAGAGLLGLIGLLFGFRRIRSGMRASIAKT